MISIAISVTGFLVFVVVIVVVVVVVVVVILIASISSRLEAPAAAGSMQSRPAVCPNLDVFRSRSALCGPLGFRGQSLEYTWFREFRVWGLGLRLRGLGHLDPSPETSIC